MPVTCNTFRKAYAFESDRPYVVPALEYFVKNYRKWISIDDIRQNVSPEIESYEWVQFARMFIERKDGCGLGFLVSSYDPKDPHGRKSYRVITAMIPEVKKFIAYCREGKE